MSNCDFEKFINNEFFFRQVRAAFQRRARQPTVDDQLGCYGFGN